MTGTTTARVERPPSDLPSLWKTTGSRSSSQTPASRKLGEDKARELIAAAETIHIAKGRKLEVFTGEDKADDFVAKMLGSTGNLRAPTIVVGATLLVGFDEQIYREVFGV